MKSNRVHQRKRQSPDAHQVRAHFGVSATQPFPFESLARPRLGLKNLVVLARHFRQKDHFANIVEQAGGKTLLHHRLGTTLAAGNALCKR